MRLLILILLLPFIAQGQIVRTHPYYKPSVSSCSYLLDQYTGAAAAYSLRKLDCDYAGSAIRVRRSSDNTEQDIGFVNGNLDTASLKTFVGTGGTDDGFVVTWYDQSGNSLNATQSTSGNQPLIMDNGVILRDGGSPCITGDGSDDRLNFSPTISSNLIYCFVAAKRQSGGTNEGRIIGFSLGDAHDWSNTNGWAALTVSTASNTVYSYRNNASVASVSVTIGTRYLYYSYLNGSGGAIATNNNSPTTGSTSSTSVNITKAGIFAAPWATSGGNFKGNIQEVIVYTSDQSSNRSSINSNINTYYSIYWDGSITGLLDTYASASAAYSLRNLSSAYTGPLIKVRRSSDNAEADIYGTYNGDLDTTSLKTFVGTGGSDNGFVVTRYDQSGNGRNATQSTSSKQPYIVKSGVVVRNGARPAIEGTAIDMYHATTATGFVTLPTHSSFSVFQQVTNTNNAGILVLAPSSGNDYASNSGIQLEINASPYNLTVQGGVATPYNIQVIGTRTIHQLATHIISSGSGELFQNGVSKGTDSYGSFSATNSGVLLIGQRYLSGSISSAYGFRGYISEIIVFNSDQSANRTAIESNINTYYSIY